MYEVNPYVKSSINLKQLKLRNQVPLPYHIVSHADRILDFDLFRQYGPTCSENTSIVPNTKDERNSTCDIMLYLLR